VAGPPFSICGLWVFGNTLKKLLQGKAEYCRGLQRLNGTPGDCGLEEAPAACPQLSVCGQAP
jgi:hypothetical protein